MTTQKIKFINLNNANKIVKSIAEVEQINKNLFFAKDGYIITLIGKFRETFFFVGETSLSNFSKIENKESRIYNFAKSFENENEILERLNSGNTLISIQVLKENGFDVSENIERREKEINDYYKEEERKKEERKAKEEEAKNQRFEELKNKLKENDYVNANELIFIAEKIGFNIPARTQGGMLKHYNFNINSDRIFGLSTKIASKTAENYLSIYSDIQNIISTI